MVSPQPHNGLGKGQKRRTNPPLSGEMNRSSPTARQSSVPRSHHVEISPPAIQRRSRPGRADRRISQKHPSERWVLNSFPRSMQLQRLGNNTPSSCAGLETPLPPEREPLQLSCPVSDHSPTSDQSRAMKKNAALDSLTQFQQGSDSLSRLLCPNEHLHKISPRSRPICPYDESERRGPVGISKSPEKESFLIVNGREPSPPPVTRSSNGTNDETSSIRSHFTASSTAVKSIRSAKTSLSNPKTCYKCKKVAQLAISPLTRCSGCPRRYHSHCAIPKIPSGNSS